MLRRRSRESNSIHIYRMKYTGRECLQEFFAKKYLEELNYPDTTVIRIDHRMGKTYINSIQTNILFPNYILNYTKGLHTTEKSIDYCFKGTITPSRQWIYQFKENSILLNSNYGRNPAVKYTLDTEYYSMLSKSKFTLCPLGDCPWSYRFFEAIMCLSIPVLEDTRDIFCKDYKFYTIDQPHIYDKEIALHNYDIFIKKNVLV